jgi:hypothetical protein
MAKFYDPLTERWYQMPEKSEPPKPPIVTPKTVSVLSAGDKATWDAIVSTATATQMSGACPDGSESAEGAS